MVLSVMISKKNRKLHFHAPLEHLFNYKACALGVKNVKKIRVGPGAPLGP